MLAFDVTGVKDAGADTVLLSSGLGGAAAYWAPQMQALEAQFRVVTYDHRGTGRTGGTVPEEGGIAAMADEVIELAASLGLTRFHFIGHALGGLIGLDIALRGPELLASLVLVNAWSRADPHSGRCFDARIALLQNSGVDAFVKAQPLFLYPAPWMVENAERLARDDAHGVAHFQGKANVLRRIAALRAFDVDDRLGEILTPTLVMAAKDDLLVPFGRSVRLSQGLANAQLALFETGAHAVNVTQPEVFNQALLAFLATEAAPLRQMPT